MSVLPFFFGFLIGAVLGTIATAATGVELHEQAATWLTHIYKSYEQRKLARQGARSGDAIPEGAESKAESAWWLPRAVLQMTKIQVLAFFVAAWTVGLLVAIYVQHPSDERPYVQYILGTLVGGATAPWIWLHFSKSMELPGPTGAGQFDRYRFMTYALGVALLGALLAPYLGKVLPKANKIEGFGVALDFERSRGDHSSNVLQVGQPATGPAATPGRLSIAARKAHWIATGHKNGELTGDPKTLKDIPENMEGFGDLSLMDRDQVYIAYFYHERNGTAEGAKFSTLADYVAAANISLDTKDAEFLASLSDLTLCIALYAERLRDFRLFLVNSEPLLGELLAKVSTNWTIKDDNAQPAATPGGRQLQLARADGLARQIVEALKFGGSGKTCPDASRLTKSVKQDVDGVGTKTPYPAYQIAHYMAAIDSVESGVLILRDWLLHQKRQPERDLDRTPEQEWYAIRAMLASSQLPGLGNAPRHRSLVQFQEETTDRLGKMLGVSDAATWRSLCTKLSRQGLHAQIGRYLAMTYADERNFLFELLLPEDLGLPPPGQPALKSTPVAAATFLQQAQAISEKTECFKGVPRYDRKLLGQYSLNLAQLRLAVRASIPEDDRPAQTKAIQADLEAASQLGTSEKGEVLDLLRESDEFAPQRERLARLKQQLDSEARKE